MLTKGLIVTKQRVSAIAPLIHHNKRAERGAVCRSPRVSNRRAAAGVSTVDARKPRQSILSTSRRAVPTLFTIVSLSTFATLHEITPPYEFALQLPVISILQHTLI